LLLFGLTLFASACLLFTSEFMFAKMVLPLLGGTPAVWTTCVLFFQAMLLVGYAYAHWSAQRLSVQRQVFVHVGVVLASVLFLPIRITSGCVPPHSANPVLWLLQFMLISIGMPFFAVSTTAPVLQRWFARTDHPAAGDPYFLYAASNAGSLAGLIGYLLLVEPRLTLRQQSLGWTAGYALLALMTIASSRVVLRSIGSHAKRIAQAVTPIAPISIARKLRWLGLAFAPSSLMLGLTAYATTDIAAVPLLWAIPLAIYLTTFIFAFSRRAIPREDHPIRLLSLVVLILTLALPKMLLSGYWELLLHLVRYAAVALVCHRKLADDRPPVQYLTVFYLLIAGGGALGGVLNGLIAPVVFRSVAEYPLVMLLACVLCLTPAGRSSSVEASDPRPSKPIVRRDVLWLSAIVITALAALAIEYVFGLYWYRLLCVGIAALLVLMCYALVRRPAMFGVALAIVLALSGIDLGDNQHPMYQARSFFGVIRVMNERSAGVHEFYHGTTLHGDQYMLPAMRRFSTSYYSSAGPTGQTFNVAASRNRNMKVAVLGLGAGTLAAYAEKGQSFAFYEIDPAVSRVATDERYFTYLSDARKRGADVRIIPGDGRLTLADAPDGCYDLIFLDAFSSDSVPVHLLTTEAVRVYLRKLRRGGILSFNISNRYLDLEPLMAELADSAGLVCLLGENRSFGNFALCKGKCDATWVIMARDVKDLGAIATDHRWRRARHKSGIRVWTDDYSDILQMLSKPHQSRRPS
jgi:hypothetical protein